MNDFIGKPTVSTGHMIIENTRPQGYCVYLDMETDKELILHHGHPNKARIVSSTVTQRILNLTLQGKPGYFIEYYDDKNYQALCEQIEKLLAQSNDQF